MAIRYSGDTEIRFTWNATKGVFEGSVRDPYMRWTGEARPHARNVPKKDETIASALYDHAAYQLFASAEAAMKKAYGKRFTADREGSRVRLRRVFQAPCPLSGDGDRDAKKRMTRRC